MNRFCFFILCLALTSRYCSQSNYTPYDTIRKDEISVSVLPLFAIFSGYSPMWQYASFNLSYKHYFKDSLVFRAAIAMTPRYNSDADQTERYLKTLDTLNLFSSSYERASSRIQLSFGFEKIFRARRFMHGIGGNLLLSYQTYSNNNPVQWYPQSISAANFTRSQYNTLAGGIYNGVDSLSYSYRMKQAGVGVQLFYSLRYRINKYFYVTSTVGPYFTALFRSYDRQRGNPAFAPSGGTIVFDANLLVSDISLAFRF